MSLHQSGIACDHGSIRTAVQPNGCPHPTVGVRLSERTLWRMLGGNAVHGNALPLSVQHALCPSCKCDCLIGRAGPAPWLCGKADQAKTAPHEFDCRQRSQIWKCYLRARRRARRGGTANLYLSRGSRTANASYCVRIASMFRKAKSASRMSASNSGSNNL
jgi:hypothetical protein